MVGLQYKIYISYIYFPKHFDIVDDNAFNSQVLSMMIKNFFSIEVDIVFDGFSAIEKVKDKMNNACWRFYKIIFMDIMNKQSNWKKI